MNRIVCQYCDRPARLVKGRDIYKGREDLAHLNFWQCAPCDAYIGTHRRNRKLGLTGAEPLGSLANAELRRARNRAHAAFDPLWRSGEMSRHEAYAWLAGELGVSAANCHIGMMDVDGCRAVVSAVVRRRAIA